ncbi:MAG: GAF domain-containing protein, partial [Actinobacteria bacterium]
EYGRERHELLGMSVSDLRAPSTRPVIADQMRDAYDSGVLFETVHVRADGTEFPVEVSSRGLDIAGERYLVSIVRDITRRTEREREREELLADLDAANSQLEGLLAIVSSAVGHVDTDEMFGAVLRSLREVLGASAALLMLRTGDGWELRARGGYETADIDAFRLGPNEGFASHVAEKGEVAWTSDVQATPAATPMHQELGVRSMLGIPLFLDGEMFGVLECTWDGERLVSDAERVMLTVAADRIMSAVVGTRTFAVTKRTATLESALADAVARLGESHVIDATMPHALEIAAQALDCDVAAFGETRDGVFTVRFGFGLGPGDVALPVTHPAGASVVDGLPVVRIGRAHGANEWLRDSFGLEEAAIVPVRARGEWAGALLFGRSKAAGGFDDLTDTFARKLSSAVALAMANAREFEQEHRIAETLQEALLTLDGSVEGIEFGVLYRSATVAARVGGDFYDVFPMPEGRVGVLIGDVSGKGLDAAVFTTLVKHTVRAFAHGSISPADIMARANDVLVASARLRDFASVLLMVVDPVSGRVAFCQAGHPPAIVRSARGVEALRCPSPVIGAFEEMEFTGCDFLLEQGDVVVLYTDGVTEARDASGRFFAEEGVVSHVSSVSDLDVRALTASLGSAVESFAGGTLVDDVAIVAFRLA